MSKNPFLESEDDPPKEPINLFLYPERLEKVLPDEREPEPAKRRPGRPRKP